MIELNNPFSDYGKVVAKGRFVGRKAEISRLQQRVLSKYGGGCAAIVGEARIGKTSLMHYVFHRDNPLVKECNGLIVSFNIGSLTFDSISKFFVSVVGAVQRELRKVSKDDSNDLDLFAKELYECIKSKDSDWNIVLLEYFQELGLKNYRVILLLDEFDSITRVFGENEAAFQLLRQLGYENRYATAIVTTSRITIGQIEVQSLISTLAGIFTDIHIGLFDEDELGQLFDSRLTGNQYLFTTQEKSEIRKFAGLHPFYAQIAGFHVWDYKATNAKESLANHEIDLALDTCRSEIYEQFDNCKHRMGENRFKSLLTVALGPSAIPFSIFDLNRLIQQGHIVEAKNGSDVYKPFSDVYEEYLNFQQKNIDLWPLWTETEKKLRELIGHRYTNLAKQLSVDKFLEQVHPDLYKKYQNYVKAQKREKQYFSVTTSPFDYMNTEDIFMFLKANWSTFHDIFGGNDKLNAWSEKFDTLRSVRNPYAHSREHAVSESRRRNAEVICHEILDKIKNSEK